MSQDYTITAARNAGEKANPHGGTLVKWYLGIDGIDQDVYSQRKPGNDFTVGQVVYGRVETGEYGPRLYLEQREDGSPGAPAGTSSTASKEDYWDAKDRRIQWAWACNLAATELAHNLTHEEVINRAWVIREQARAEELSGADLGGGSRSSQNEPAADVSAEPRSENWADGVSTFARTMPGGDLAPPPELASPQLKGKATQLLNKAGLAKGARQAVIMFRCGTLKDPPRDRLQGLVRDLQDGATAESLLAEVSDAARAGNNPLATRAAAMIPTDVPLAEDPNEKAEAYEDESGVPF